MRRKLTIWLVSLTAGAFVLPYATCATSSINGVIQAFKPCDVLNCENPQYFDPCMFIQCNRYVRLPTLSSSTTDTTGGTTGGSVVVTNNSNTALGN